MKKGKGILRLWLEAACLLIYQFRSWETVQFQRDRRLRDMTRPVPEERLRLQAEREGQKKGRKGKKKLLAELSG